MSMFYVITSILIGEFIAVGYLFYAQFTGHHIDKEDGTAFLFIVAAFSPFIMPLAAIALGAAAIFCAMILPFYILFITQKFIFNKIVNKN